jgi:hypothetical protein
MKKKANSYLHASMPQIAFISLSAVFLTLTAASARRELDPSWTVTGSLGTARDFHTATLLPDGRVLVAGGFGTSDVLSSAQLYDPAAGMWTTTGSLGSARRLHTATLLSSGKVLVSGGFEGSN